MCFRRDGAELGSQKTFISISAGTRALAQHDVSEHLQPVAPGDVHLDISGWVFSKRRGDAGSWKTEATAS